MPHDREQRVAYHRKLWLQRFANALENECREQATQTPLVNTDTPTQDVIGNSITPHSFRSPLSPLIVDADSTINNASLPSRTTIESAKGQNSAVSGASSGRGNLAAKTTVSDVLRGGAQHRVTSLSLNTRKRFRVESSQRRDSQSSAAEPPQCILPTEARTSTVSTVTSPPSVPQGPPEWYTRINLDRLKPKRGDRETVARLRNIGTLIHQAKAEAVTETGIPPGLFDKIRNELHFLEFLDVNEYSVRKAQLLDNHRGLPQLFNSTYSSGVNYPWDIQSDAEELHNKWYQKMFTTDLLRGIKVPPRNSTLKDSGWKIESDKIPWKYHGKGLLINGQWWPRQICAVRDGAHGFLVGGISGIKGEGAVSVVMSGDEYHDEDQDDGEEVWYCGTKAKARSSGPTEMTKHLLDSINFGKPVRLMRSSNLYGSKFKPSQGFRYDGLYEVVEKELLDPNTHHYRFHLVRMKGQTPIRYQGLGARPTAEERKAWEKLQLQLGLKGGRN